MPRLATPLKPLLRDGFGEADVRRVWRNISSRIEPHQRRRQIFWQWALGGVAFAAALSFVMFVLHPWDSASDGPLEIARGGAPSVLTVAPSESKRSVPLADGSEIILDSDSRLEVLANDGSTFVTALRRGRSSFSVRPGGRRRWVVECGLATVEVVGTEFAIERSHGRLDVSVSRGVVTVRGELVPDRLRRLEAGQNLVVVGHEPLHSEDEVAPALPAVSAARTELLAPLEPVVARTKIGTERVAAGRRSATHQPDELDELLHRADMARSAGDLNGASELLEKTIRHGGRDPRAAVAALTLARLKMNSAPERAARVLSAVLTSGVPRGLEEDIWARLVEARARSNDRAGTFKAASEYETRFPNGARLAEVRRWLAP